MLTAKFSLLVEHSVKQIPSVRCQTRRTQHNAPGFSVSRMEGRIGFGIIDASSLMSTSRISKARVATSQALFMRSVVGGGGTNQKAP